jgi:hypothetical protein
MDIVPEKDIKLMTKMVENPDKDIRNNAVVCLAEIYKCMGPNIHKYLGNVSKKSLDIIESRFKTIKPPSPKHAAAPQPKVL